MGRPKTVKSIDYLIQNYTIEDLTTGCWEWNGGRHVQGYPMCRFDGKMHITARSFYETVHNIDLKFNERVINQCGNVDCVNPKHYEVGKKGNDFWRKGGSPYRFTQEEADALKAEYDAIPLYHGKRKEFREKHNISDMIMAKLIKGTYVGKK